MKKLIATSLCLTLASPCFAIDHLRAHRMAPRVKPPIHHIQKPPAPEFHNHHHRHHMSTGAKTAVAVAGIAGIAILFAAIAD